LDVEAIGMARPVEPIGAEEDETEVEKAWIEEALRRRAELVSSEVEGIPAEEVFRELRAKRR
jgi:hypothetical protein